MICSYVKVNEKDIKTLQEVEKEVGQTLLAIDCHDFKPAQLTSEQLERVQALEKELGVVVVAV